jgi:hypothetical protein
MSAATLLAKARRSPRTRSSGRRARTGGVGRRTTSREIGVFYELSPVHPRTEGARGPERPGGRDRRPRLGDRRSAFSPCSRSFPRSGSTPEAAFLLPPRGRLRRHGELLAPMEPVQLVPRGLLGRALTRGRRRRPVRALLVARRRAAVARVVRRRRPLPGRHAGRARDPASDGLYDRVPEPLRVGGSAPPGVASGRSRAVSTSVSLAA